jgi:hypothetical protein
MGTYPIARLVRGLSCLGAKTRASKSKKETIVKALTLIALLIAAIAILALLKQETPTAPLEVNEKQTQTPNTSRAPRNLRKFSDELRAISER